MSANSWKEIAESTGMDVRVWLISGIRTYMLGYITGFTKGLNQA